MFSCEGCGLMTKLGESGGECEECGGTMLRCEEAVTQPDPSPGTTRPRSRRRRDDLFGISDADVQDGDSPQRLQAGLRKARETAQGLKFLYLVTAVCLALTFVAAFFRVETGFVVIALVVYGLPAILGFGLGAQFLPRAPAGISLGLSLLMTVYSLGAFWMGSVLLMIVFAASSSQQALPAAAVVLGIGILLSAFQIFMTVMCWIGSVRLGSLRELIRGNPNWFEPVARRSSRSAAEGGSDRAARAQSGGASEGLRRAGFVAIAVVATILVAVLATGGGEAGNPVHTGATTSITAEEQALREKSHELDIARLAGFWQSSDRQAILGMVPAIYRENARRELDRTLKRFGFEGDLPKLGDPRDLWSRRDQDSVKTYFAIPATDDLPVRAKLRTVWAHRSEGWVLTEIGLRKTTN